MNKVLLDYLLWTKASNLLRKRKGVLDHFRLICAVRSLLFLVVTIDIRLWQVKCVITHFLSLSWSKSDFLLIIFLKFWRREKNRRFILKLQSIRRYDWSWRSFSVYTWGLNTCIYHLLNLDSRKICLKSFIWILKAWCRRCILVFGLEAFKSFSFLFLKKIFFSRLLVVRMSLLWFHLWICIWDVYNEDMLLCCIRFVL